MSRNGRNSRPQEHDEKGGKGTGWDVRGRRGSGHGVTKGFTRQREGQEFAYNVEGNHWRIASRGVK